MNESFFMFTITIAKCFGFAVLYDNLGYLILHFAFLNIVIDFNGVFGCAVLNEWIKSDN